MRGRILVVEDNLPNRELMCDWLEANGYEVLSVSDILSAVEALKNQELDAVLLDVQLGNEDGLALAIWMRQETKFCGIPVIAVTAHAMATEQRRFLQAGCNACVSKPVNFKLLGEQLDWWLAPINRPSDQPVGSTAGHNRAESDEPVQHSPLRTLEENAEGRGLPTRRPKAQRRSPRVLANISLRIQSGGESLEAFTAVINLHGALIVSTVNWPAGTLLTATNLETRLTVHARVVWSAVQESNGAHKLGVEFEVGSPEFWGDRYDPEGVDFPESLSGADPVRR